MCTPGAGGDKGKSVSAMNFCQANSAPADKHSVERLLRRGRRGRSRHELFGDLDQRGSERGSGQTVAAEFAHQADQVGLQ